MTKRIWVLAVTVAVAASALALTVGAAGAKTSKGKTKAKADSGVAYFSITHQVGKTQYAAGDGKDKLLGNTAETYQIALTPATAGTVNVTAKKVTIYDGTGSMSGTATATVTIAGTAETISNGKLDLTKGKGSLKGHSLIATFTGSADTAANQYTFRYKGTFK